MGSNARGGIECARRGPRCRFRRPDDGGKCDDETELDRGVLSFCRDVQVIGEAHGDARMSLVGKTRCREIRRGVA